MSTRSTPSSPEASNRNARTHKRRRGAGNNSAPFKPAHPVLARLADSHPALFGAQPLPLKRGIFADLQQDVPDLDTEELKQALGIHTRSNRYLQAVAAGKPRHDLQGAVVEPMALEHVFHALAELFRRRLRRAEQAGANEQAQSQALQTEAEQWFEKRLAQAIADSGLSANDYLAAVTTKDARIRAILTAVASQATEQHAREEAMLRAYEASGASVPEFAEMYGLTTQEAGLMLARARLRLALPTEGNANSSDSSDSSDSDAAAEPGEPA